MDTILRELTGRKGAEAGRIEAFLLQIVCSSIEKRVVEKELGEVSTDELPNFDTVFEDYYQDRIDELPEDEHLAARLVLEQGLLLVETQSGDGRRLSRDAGELAQAFGVAPELLQNLERTYLIRREVNSLGGFNYEISHDTLIAPVLKARKEYEAIQEAARIEQERLEAEARTREAERQVAEEKKRAEEAERLQNAAEQGQKRARLFALLASVVAVLAIMAFVYAYQQQKLAEESAGKTQSALEELQEAIRKRDEAEAEKVLSLLVQYKEKAKILEVRRPEQAQDLLDSAKTMLKQYPFNPVLQDSLRSLITYDSLRLINR